MAEERTLIPELSEDYNEPDEVPTLGRFVFGSGPRIHIFRDIQSGIHYSDLTEEYGDSLASSTVNDFREKNLAMKTDENFVRLTPLGRYMAENFAELVNDLKQVKRVNEFFAAIPPGAYEILDRDVIEGGETLSGSPVDKNAVIHDYVNYIRQADEIKEIVPTLIRAGLYDTDGNSIYRQQIMNGDLYCSFIHTEEVVAAIENVEKQRVEAQEHQGTHHVEYYRYDDSFPFTLTIYDDELVTMLVDDSDGVKILFRNDSDACVEWANDIYDEYRERSEQITY